MPKSDMVQSLLKALDILELVVDAEEGVRLNEVTEKLNLHKSTAHNLARTLMARGYLVKDSVNRYQPGPVLEEMHRRRNRRALLRRAEEVLVKLQNEYPKATLTFSELVFSEICCRLRLSPVTPGGLRRPPAQTFSAFGSASGLCLQAVNAEYRQWMAAPGIFDESGQRCWSTRSEFDTVLRETARCGIAKINKNNHRRFAVAVGDNFALGMSLELAAAHENDAAARLIAAAQEIAAEV